MGYASLRHYRDGWIDYFINLCQSRLVGDHNKHVRWVHLPNK